MNKNHYAVILAGGSGTRFWPRSREACPKQFLKMTSSKTLLQETVERNLKFFPARNILIVANQKYRRILSAQIKGYGIPAKNRLYEPVAKNTAPAVYWAALEIAKRNPEGVMAVFPADHVIANAKEYGVVIKKGIKAAQNNRLVTFGIQPTRPETGYGYIQGKAENGKQRTEDQKNKDVMDVARFVEKPDTKTAKRYVKQGNYFWNSGMFVWKAERILKDFHTCLPEVAGVLSLSCLDNIQKLYASMPSVSVDYGILEKAENIALVKTSRLGWSDLGSWESLQDYLKENGKQDIFPSESLALEARDSLVVSDTKRLVVLCGVKDLIVVDTRDALLIADRKKSQDVRNIVAVLKQNKNLKKYA